MASTASFGSLSVALANAITYLTRPLIEFYSATQIIKLQLALEANLTTQFEASWIPSDPLRGSGRRCLTFSPSCAPPRPIYNACKSASIDWSKWMTALGGVEFDLFIDPGCVSLRFATLGSKTGKFFTVWAQEAPSPAPRTPSSVMGKTVAQQIILADGDEDEELFAMLSDEIREPTWVTPIASQFPHVPAPPRSPSPISVISAMSSHSRTSSCSSLSSSGFSFFSRATEDSYGSATTVSLSSSMSSSCSISIDDDEKPKFVKLSRRERARQAKVFIDTSKKEVTNYDGGKTTVLTGGVMLGAASKAKPAPSARKSTSTSSATNWRSGRA